MTLRATRCVFLFSRAALVKAALVSAALIGCDAGQAKPAAEGATAEKSDADTPSKAGAKADASKASADKAATKAEAKAELVGDVKVEALSHEREIEHATPKLDAAKAKADAATFAAALQAGRQAAEAKDYDQAIAQFGTALKLDPNHPGALGELGWVAFRKGELELAHAATMKAMSHVKSPARKGALLYNLGRIEEAQGRLEHALDLYHRSLSVRDDDLVAKRVVEVEGRLAAADAPPSPPAYTSIDALCEAELLDLVVCPEDDEEGVCGCSAEKTIENPSAEGVIKSAAIISVGSFVSGVGLEEYGYLALETRSRGWQLVSLVGDGSEPGLSYIHNAWTLKTFEFVEIEGGGTPELVVSVERTEADGDYGANALEFADWTDMWLCSEGEPAARCVVFEIASEIGLDKMLVDGEAPDPEEWGPLGSHQYTVEVSYAEGKVVLKDAGVATQERAKYTGSFTLAELAGAAWTELIELH